jgi:hypothetical protein
MNNTMTTLAMFLFAIAVLILAMIAPLFVFKLSGGITLTMLASVPLTLSCGLAIEMLDDIA